MEEKEKRLPLKAPAWNLAVSFSVVLVLWISIVLTPRSHFDPTGAAMLLTRATLSVPFLLWASLSLIFLLGRIIKNRSLKK